MGEQWQQTMLAQQKRFAEWFTGLPENEQHHYLECEGIEKPSDFVGLDMEEFLISYFGWD